MTGSTTSSSTTRAATAKSTTADSLPSPHSRGYALRIPEVFSATHALIRWCEAELPGCVSTTPTACAIHSATCTGCDRSLGAMDHRGEDPRAGEELPKTWPVAGTTGYDAMREVNGVFIDHDHEPEFTALYQRLTGDQGTIGDHIEAGKRLVVNTLLPAEVRRMAALASSPNAGPHLPRWRLRSLPLVSTGRCC